jgi:hypothetical protein
VRASASSSASVNPLQTFRTRWRRPAGFFILIIRKKMSSHFILQDGRGWSAGGMLFDAVLNKIAFELKKTEGGRALGEWLSEERQVVWLGMCGLDLRDLTVENQKEFCNAVRAALKSSASSGSNYWNSAHLNEPEPFLRAMKKFRHLEQMLSAIERKEPPDRTLNDFTKIIEWKPDKQGPGWN